MYRPGYGVVTTVVVVLCLIALFTILMGPRIPAVSKNRMGNTRDDFLRQSRFEDVDWITFGSRTLGQAKELNRPILLVIGSPSCTVGRDLDRQTLADPEVAAYLDRNFVCVRIDGAAHPEWLNALLPFSRLRDPFWPDLQIWALDVVGHIFDFIGRPRDEDFSPTPFLSRLVGIRQEFADLGPSGVVSSKSLQHEDTQFLRPPRPNENPTGESARTEAIQKVSESFGLYSAVVRAIGERSEAGFPVKSWLGLTPQVWRYLVLTGDRATFDWAVTGGILRSPMADLLDGGFFHSESIRDGRIVEFDKQTAENADAMLALAEYCSLVRNPSVRRMADETWRYLAGSFRGAKGFVQGQVGADGYRQRSPRYSVPTGRLRESLTPPLQTWAREHLGLDAARFPQAVPFLATGVLFDPRLQDVMDALRRTTAAEPVTVDVGMADSSLTCAARSIQSARIWNDPIRLTQALGWLDALEPLRVDGDVMRRVGGRQGEFGYLGDYLAYADARLQAYVATGRAASFDLGLRVMRRARELFAHRRPGNPDPTVWVLNPPRESMVVRDAVVPEVADNLHESCTARVIRLSMAYGRLLGPTEEGRAFLRIAAETTRDLRQIALTGGPQSAGFFCAAAEVFDPYFAVTVGPAARELGDETAAAVPTRLVAPAAGAVRRDLQGRAPGVYVVGDRIEGPFTPKEAARELGLVYYLSPPH